MLKLILNFWYDTITIAQYETVKIIRAPLELFTRSVQPILWLLIFGEVFARLHTKDLGGGSYVAFIAPGILAQSVLFIAIFQGISIIWERDLGILQKVLVAPISRAAIVLGKGFSAGVRALSQLLVVLVLADLLGVKLNFAPYSIIGILIFILLEASIFATLSSIVACLVKTRERFLGIGQVITMPLFFASNAIYPIAIMPHWVQIVSHWNPLTYEIDALRFLMLTTTPSAYGLATGFCILFFTLVALTVIGGWVYPKIAR